jgi:hypothetical protein
MIRNNAITGLVLLGIIFIFSGCGGVGGAPGADSGNTGILITSISIEGDEPAGGDNEIDCALHMCDQELEEGLFIANAILTINTVPAGFSGFPANVEECTVNYIKGNENPDAPIIESLTTYPNCTLIEGQNFCTLVMIDIDRKVEFWDDFTSLNFTETYPVHYVARFDCTYVNQYGESGSFNVEYDIWLADWDYC